MKETVKKYIPLTLRPFVREIIYFVKSMSSERYVKKVLKERDKIFLEIGSGGKKGGGNWVTLDMAPGCDVYWDLSRGLPFPTGSIDKIYSSHLFEHFTFSESQKLLGECLRVLVPGGVFSVCVPNAKIYIEAYCDNLSIVKERMLGYKPAYNSTTKIDYLNYIAYMDGHHKYMFDEENLLHILNATGFRNVHLRPFDKTLDLVERDFESIYAEGQK